VTSAILAQELRELAVFALYHMAPPLLSNEGRYPVSIIYTSSKCLNLIPSIRVFPVLGEFHTLGGFRPSVHLPGLAHYAARSNTLTFASLVVGHVPP
jgi:hypothetical protein